MSVSFGALRRGKVLVLDLDPKKKSSWDALTRAFLSKYGDHDNLKEIWKRLIAIPKSYFGSYSSYKTQFLKLWAAQWKEILPKGERATKFLKKEKFVAGLAPLLQDKGKGKF